MADDLERPDEPAHEESEQHLPTPTILPFAFAGGVALILVGLVINWWLAVAGGVLALLFGFAWIREVTRDVRAAPEPEPVVAEEPVSELTVEEEGPEEPERYPRSVFLEMSTLGIDATHKWESEGARDWPERIEMTAEVRDLVSRRWSEYGLAPREAQNGGISRVLRQTVRR